MRLERVGVHPREAGGVHAGPKTCTRVRVERGVKGKWGNYDKIHRPVAGWVVHAEAAVAGEVRRAAVPLWSFDFLVSPGIHAMLKSMMPETGWPSERAIDVAESLL